MARRVLSARQPARLLLPVPSRHPDVAEDVGLRHAVLVELVSLRCWVAARGALNALSAGSDVAVDCHARTIPLRDDLAQW